MADPPPLALADTSSDCALPAVRTLTSCVLDRFRICAEISMHDLPVCIFVSGPSESRRACRVRKEAPAQSRNFHVSALSKRLTMGNDAARLAAHIPQGSIAPDVAFRAFGMALDGHCSERVISPYSARAPAQRTVATRGFNGRRRQGQAHCSAMAASLQRWRWLFVIHHLSPGANRLASFPLVLHPK